MAKNEERIDKRHLGKVDVGALVAFKKQAEAAAAKRQRPGGAAEWQGDPEFSDKYPNTWTLFAASLVDLDCDPGTTMSVWVNGDGWFCCFSPRWTGLKTFQRSDTFMGLIGALEAFLSDEDPDWRTEDGKRRSKQRKKR